MNEQFVFQVDDQGFRFCPVALLPRKRNQSVDFAFRRWLAEHGNPDASYQVLEVVSPRISVFVRTRVLGRCPGALTPEEDAFILADFLSAEHCKSLESFSFLSHKGRGKLESAGLLRCHERLAGYGLAGCSQRPAGPVQNLAEGTGFEPVSRVVARLADYKSAPINRSGTPRSSSFLASLSDSLNQFSGHFSGFRNSFLGYPVFFGSMLADNDYGAFSCGLFKWPIYPAYRLARNLQAPHELVASYGLISEEHALSVNEKQYGIINRIRSHGQRDDPVIHTHDFLQARIGGFQVVLKSCPRVVWNGLLLPLWRHICHQLHERLKLRLDNVRWPLSLKFVYPNFDLQSLIVHKIRLSFSLRP